MSKCDVSISIPSVMTTLAISSGSIEQPQGCAGMLVDEFYD